MQFSRRCGMHLCSLTICMTACSMFIHVFAVKLLRSLSSATPCNSRFIHKYSQSALQEIAIALRCFLQAITAGVSDFTARLSAKTQFVIAGTMTRLLPERGSFRTTCKKRLILALLAYTKATNTYSSSKSKPKSIHICCRHFAHFAAIVAEAPGQCLRYCFDEGAAPLWPSRQPVPIPQDIPACPHCGTSRRFEFQARPHTKS